MTSTTALASLFSVVCIWVLLFWFHHDYCIDKFRQDMFGLRDKLFDRADSGGISFDHPAYGLLRTTMNGFIRFAHRLTLLQVALLGVPRGDDSQAFSRQWDGASGDLTNEQRREIADFRYRMEVLVVKHLLRSSPIVVLTVVPPIVGWIAVRLFLRQTISFFRGQLEGIDSAALEFGSDTIG